ncbi:MAG: NB-ARC domain-containing protein [Chloroflexota bacterium]
MTRLSYPERDYGFGQVMLTLRTTIGLTQAGLADYLAVSRRAVGEWESGGSYPKIEHLKQFIALALAQKAFPVGHEAEAIRGLWRDAQQKVLIDEMWIATLLASQSVDEASHNTYEQRKAFTSSLNSATRVDWGDALTVKAFYGREWELNLLTGWVVEEHCRVISVLGLGGIGKSSLSVQLMHQVAEHFEVVIWRSLRDTPACEALFDDLVQFITPPSASKEPGDLEQSLSLLLEYMRSARTLIVLDNLESVLEDAEHSGQIHPGYEALARFIRQSAGANHQSCLLLTSREKLSDLMALEGNQSPVRTLRLARLDIDSCEALLIEKGITGTDDERAQLIDIYAGNPLALKVIAQTIADLFDGAIAPFLQQGEVIFGSVRDLLGQQFERLSDIEQTLLLWLAILREPATFDELSEIVLNPISRTQLLEAMDRLYRRSLIERGQRQATFTLQSVVLEYLTSRLIDEAYTEIQHGKLSRLIEHGLELAHVKDYVRQSQDRLLLSPLLTRLEDEYTDLEAQLQAILDDLRALPHRAQGYASANLLALLRLMQGHLRGLNLSGLAFRSAYLQGTEMQDTDLSNVMIYDNTFTQPFNTLLAVAVSGDCWAASSSRGEVMLWTANGMTLRRTWQAHNAMIWAAKFSPDGRFLATGGWDNQVKVWESATGTLMWSGKHLAAVNSLAFSPDGRLLASASEDATVALWDLESGRQLQLLPHPAAVTGSGINWTPDGKMLISGDKEGSIRLWDIPNFGQARCVKTIAAHSTFVDGLVLSPDGQLLASSSLDGTVKLWNIVSGQLLHLRQSIVGHKARIGRLGWSPDGRTLACGGIDTMVWIFDVEDGHYRHVLQGHVEGITGLTFTPDGDSLLSCGGHTLHLWDANKWQCTRVIEGYSNFFTALDWSVDGTQLIGGCMDGPLALWDLHHNTPPKLLHGHGGAIMGIGWSPDGKWLASSEWDNAIRLWNPTTGVCVRTLHHPDDPANFFSALDWSPDGTRFACGTSQRGVQVFEITSALPRWVGSPFPSVIQSVAWSPDGRQLAGAGGGSCIVYLWDAEDGTLLHSLEGHAGAINCLAWSPDGRYLASGSRDKEAGELFVWDTQCKECIYTFMAHPGTIQAITWITNEEIITGDVTGILRWWRVQNNEYLLTHETHIGSTRALKRNPDGTKLASCSDDGTIKIWDLNTGEHCQTLRRDRPYERLNITGIRGLTEAQKSTLCELGAFENN